MYYECRHIMHNGARCHSPALRDNHYCYYHKRLHAAATLSSHNPPKGKAEDVSLHLPFLEDRSAIQVALSRILEALASAKLDPRRAGMLLYGLQVATQNVERRQDILPYKAVEDIVISQEGQELAPRILICNLDDKCSICPHRETCTEIDPDEEENED